MRLLKSFIHDFYPKCRDYWIACISVWPCNNCVYKSQQRQVFVPTRVRYQYRELDAWLCTRFFGILLDFYYQFLLHTSKRRYPVSLHKARHHIHNVCLYRPIDTLRPHPYEDHFVYHTVLLACLLAAALPPDPSRIMPIVIVERNAFDNASRPRAPVDRVVTKSSRPLLLPWPMMGYAQ